MKIHDVEQGTQAWHDLRAGKMTASHATEIGNCGAGLKTYIYKMLAAKHSSAELENYTNEHMERGIILEPQAREMYELQTGNKVEEVGFVEMDKFIGASPDGLIGEDGGIEIKCLSDEKYFKMLVNKKPDSGYVWQCQMSLLVTERKWWALVYYNPNFEESMIIFDVAPDEEKYEKLLAGFEMGKDLMKEIENKICLK